MENSPANTESVQFVELNNLGGGTFKLTLKIKGIKFERLHQHGVKTIVWQDPTSHFKGPLILDNKKTADLEGIFHNYCIEVEFDINEF